MIARFGALALALTLALGALTPAQAAFRDTLAGARLLGIGGAGVALVDDTASLVLNPAGLGNVGIGERRQILSVTYGGQFVGLSDGNDITQSLVSYAQSTGLGFAWKRTQAGRLYSENRVGVGYGRAMGGSDGRGGRLTAGVKAELLTWDVAPTIGATGNIIEDLSGPTRLDFTLGAVYALTSSEAIYVPLGVSIHHLTRPDVASSSSEVSESLPLQVLFGIGAVGGRTLWAFDIEMEGRDVDIRTGFEWEAHTETLFLRTGFRLEGLAFGANITFGAGLQPTENLRVDYAFWLPVGGVSDTLGSHRIGVAYVF